MIQYTDTTVFNVGVQTIVNTVNCVGVMGAGLALEYQLRFPEMYQEYVERCKRKSITTGRPYLYKGYEIPWIMNFPTKNHWKYPSKIEWLEQGLDYFIKNYQRGGITSIAFPKLGCENGGLNWDDVRDVMEKYFQKVKIDVYICLDQELEASGIEGIMVDLVNNQQNQFWIPALEVRDDLAEKILKSLPINRFRDLRKISGIGKQTYNDLFKLLYSIVVKRNSELSECANTAEQNQLISETFEPVTLAQTEPIIRSPMDRDEPRTKPTISKPDVKNKLAVDVNQRNNAMWLLKNTLGIEAFDIQKLKWSDFKNNEDKGQIMVFSKVIPTSLWQEIQPLRGDAESEAPVFCKSKGEHLSLSSVKKILHDAAKKAENVTQLELDLVY